MSEYGNWPGTMKKTRQRLLVWGAMKQAEGPVTALEIAGWLEGQGTPVWLSTIYRVLDAFAEAGLVGRTGELDGGMALYELAGHSHRHYAVCMNCRRITPLKGCPMGAFATQMEEEGFEVTSHRLQLYGYCLKCKAKAHEAAGAGRPELGENPN